MKRKIIYIKVALDLYSKGPYVNYFISRPRVLLFKIMFLASHLVSITLLASWLWSLFSQILLRISLVHLHITFFYPKWWMQEIQFLGEFWTNNLHYFSWGMYAHCCCISMTMKELFCILIYCHALNLLLFDVSIYVSVVQLLFVLQAVILILM